MRKGDIYMKKLVALVLAVVMVLSVSMVAFAAGTDVGDGNGDGHVSWEDIVNASIKKGDLNGDKEVTAYDARLALKLAAGDGEITNKELKAADLNSDGNVTAYDARMILKLATEG